MAVCAHKLQAKATSARTQPMSMQKLHQVLQPKVTKPVRSTKPLTLPDDFELETDKRLANRAEAAAAATEGQVSDHQLILLLVATARCLAAGLHITAMLAWYPPRHLGKLAAALLLVRWVVTLS